MHARFYCNADEKKLTVKKGYCDQLVLNGKEKSERKHSSVWKKNLGFGFFQANISVSGFQNNRDIGQM